MTRPLVAMLTLAPLALLGSAWAEVRTLLPFDQLYPPDEPQYQSAHVFGRDVAIDGGAIIVLTDHNAGRSALLYRRDGNGRWSFRRTLLTVTSQSGRAEVRMRNGIAAVLFGDRAWFFERGNGHYVLGPTSAPVVTPVDSRSPGTPFSSGAMIAITTPWSMRKAATGSGA